MAFVASLSNAIGFSARAADLVPIVQGGGYYNWSGYYVGGNVGAGVGRIDFTAVMPGLSMAPPTKSEGSSAAARADSTGNSAPGSPASRRTFNFPTSATASTLPELQFTNTLDYFSTLRGRLGYAMDEWLFYVTAGGGYAGTQVRLITT